MKTFSWMLGALTALVLSAGPATAADAVAAGKIKSVNAEKKEFVLTDSAGKDWTFKLGENVVINRGGKESQNDLKDGDPINVYYDKGVLTWTANYILVQEGDTKDCMLMYGRVKKYDADTKTLTCTDPAEKDWSCPLGSGKVRLTRKGGEIVNSKIGEVKIGDKAVAIVQKADDGATTLKCLMIDRK